MYKNLKKLIKELEAKSKTNEKELKENKSKIQRYERELERIRKMFPENYFNE